MTLINKILTEVRAWAAERRRCGSHEPRHDELLADEVELLRQKVHAWAEFNECTCVTCEDRAECEFAYDLYNTSGDCLAIK